MEVQETTSGSESWPPSGPEQFASREAPDPKRDFDGWAAHQEQQVYASFEGRMVDPAEVALAIHECHDRIDAKEEELGIPAAPLDPVKSAEIAERAAAVTMAATSLAPLSPDISWDEGTRLLLERAQAIMRGEYVADGAEQAELAAREQVARLYERRSRGEKTYLAFARRLRTARFSLSSRRRVQNPAPRQRRVVARPREHRASARTRPSRGDPSSPDDADLDRQLPVPSSRRGERGSGAAASVLAAALAYRDLGWSVIPTLRDKRPHGAALAAASGSSAWSRLRTEPASEGEISHWYTRFPEAGVAILTGRPSGPVVVDFDGPLPAGIRLAETPIARTGRGLHLYLHSDGAVQSRNLPTVDLKGEGGYVVAPPSLHPSGQRYEWLLAPEGLGTLTVPDAPLATFTDLEHWGPHELFSRDAEGGPTGVDIYSCSPPRFASRDGDERGLRDWDRDPGFVEAARSLLGIPRGHIGQTFRCVLPGHEEHHPSASLFVEPRHQTVVYRDWHTDSWYTLTEVYAAQKASQVRKLRGPEHARWKLRLLLELSILTPAAVAMPTLPPGAPANASAVFEGFRLLLACRGTTEPDKPAPFTGQFGAAWCGLSSSRFQKGKGWLIKQELIRPAGWYGRTRLWLPGESEAS